MNKFNTILILAIFLCPLALYSVMSHLGYHGNVSNAEGVKPKMVMITSTMCSECVKMKKVLEKVQPSYQKNISFERYDANSPGAKPYIDKYNITLVPTLIFFERDGSLYKKIEGGIPQDVLENYLKELKKDGKP